MGSSSILLDRNQHTFFCAFVVIEKVYLGEITLIFNPNEKSSLIRTRSIRAFRRQDILRLKGHYFEARTRSGVANGSSFAIDRRGEEASEHPSRGNRMGLKKN